MAVLANIDNVLFDLDGTLVDSRETIATSILHALEKMDVDAATGPRVETLIGMPLYDIFVGRFGMEEANALRAIDHYRVYYDNLNQAGTTVYERVHEDLARLKAEGYRLYIATVKPTQSAAIARKRPPTYITSLFAMATSLIRGVRVSSSSGWRSCWAARTTWGIR